MDMEKAPISSTQSCLVNRETLELARLVFEDQSRALSDIGHSLNDEFLAAVELIYGCTGKVIVSGMGKSGIIGRKIAATLASTGTPSFFVHPGEAYHGDLGMIGSDDLVILISYSGETDEVIKLLPYLRHIEARSVAITGNESSTLGTSADVHLNVSVERESCPNNLAPTTSTTATLVMGDALAVALMNRRAFMPLDFARFHPGGSLGRKLLTLAKDVMHRVPSLSREASFAQVVHEISEGHRGIVCVVDDAGQMVGVVTDGDLRRAIEKQGQTEHLTANDIMGRMPVTISPDANLYDCEQLMRERKLTSLIVAEGQEPLGVVKSFDA
ncbi:SIS domain-containing protein [uncultured Salinicola sp.]|uniref:KpsF/GutQ family sugar-phosphate isomerase n=1 Tax=uncultured Salinicola sp. TaxID=1193542 RepID=UPI00261F0001|nr:KpsF/GutQ family sugar-phosphate isomerase [uncultured Salinicola sp.]|tara:strand:+ start:3652 stop:4635 length:984 start_codon:yes stop_codon:yes gene_type:complete